MRFQFETVTFCWFAHAGPNSSIKFGEIALVVFSCAILREKYYGEFKYDFKALMCEQQAGEDIIRVAYKIKP